MHRDGILHTSTVPAHIDAALAGEAPRIADEILGALDYVGVIGIEFFQVGGAGGERLLVNEFAPRVHNSGHWTEDACAVSQFENHIRAIAGWPLGPTARHADAVHDQPDRRGCRGLGALAAEPAPACISTASARRARAARWGMSHGSVPCAELASPVEVWCKAAILAPAHFRDN